MESRFATPSDGVTIRYAIGRTSRAFDEQGGDRFVFPGSRLQREERNSTDADLRR